MCIYACISVCVCICVYVYYVRMIDLLIRLSCLNPSELVSLIPELEKVRSGAEALTDEVAEGVRECARRHHDPGGHGPSHPSHQAPCLEIRSLSRRKTEAEQIIKGPCGVQCCHW
jgi:hypothetical protein